MKKKSETMSKGLRKKEKRTQDSRTWGEGNVYVNEAKTETQTGIKLSCESQEIIGLRQAYIKPRKTSFFYSRFFSSLSITRLSKMCEYEVKHVPVCV